MTDEVTITTIDTPAAPVVETPAPAVTETPVEPPKTFTQEDVDKAITARLAREQAKHSRQLQEAREDKIRLEERLSAAQPKTVESTGEPKLEDFDDFQKYIKAVAKHEAAQAAGEVTKASKTEAEKAQANMRAQQAMQGYTAKVQVFMKEAPDFTEVVSNTPAPLTGAMKEFILESDQGPRLAYYLAQHPDEAEAIAVLTPLGAARKLTLIEAGFTANVTKTPPPINTIGSRATSAVKSIADVTSQTEWEKRRREFRAKR